MEKNVKDVASPTEIANKDDVVSAINLLTDVELIKLERFATRRINICNLSTLGYTNKDLLNQAIVDTLDGTRTWNINSINFYTHLAGVIRSISGHWFEKYKKNHSSLEGMNYDTSELLLTESNSGLSHEKTINEEQLIKYILGKLCDDEIALKVINLLYKGYKGPEIKQKMDLNQSQYETIMKRIRRKTRTKLTSEALDEI